MSTTPTAFIDARVLGSADESTGATGAGPPGLVASAPASESQHAVQDEPLRPKYLDPEWMKDGVPDTQFYKDYPPDPWGEEAFPNARVWKIYRDDRTTADAATLKSWNSTLDVLLIFAGLFSAVSTAFIVESYKSLQPDYTQYIANFLYAAATNSSVVNGGILIQMYPTAASLGPPDSFVHPSATSRWANGLWFTSLVTSLTVALLCILVKQWLDEYHGRIARSAPSFREWARRHQLYYRGLNAWGVPALVSLLPLLLHISLFLFFVGLILFLRPLDGAIANTLLAIFAFVLLFYVLALVIPALRVECPSYTPLLAQAQLVVGFGLSLLCWAIALPWPGRFVSLEFDLGAGGGATELRLPLETAAIDAQQFKLDGWALTTLLTTSNDAEIIDASVEAIGVTSVATLDIMMRDPPKIIHHRTNRDFLRTCATSSAFAVMSDARRVRALWSIRFMQLRGGSFAYPDQRLMTDLYPSLGIEGMMLQLMGACHGDAANSQRDHNTTVSSLLLQLSAYVAAEPLGPESVRGSLSTGPGRATCLLFLVMLSQGVIELGRNPAPFILLTFCAGNFSKADSHELELALRAVCGCLQRDDDIADLLDCSFAIVNALKRGRMHEESARLFAHHLGILLYHSRMPKLESVRWAQLPGFAAFVTRLANLEQCDSPLELAGYVRLLGTVDDSSHEGLGTESSRQYWTCVATLLNLSCKFELPFDIHMCEGRGLAQKVENLLNDPRRALPFLDHSSDAILLMFLQIPSTVGSGMVHDLYKMMGYSSFIKLAEGLSCILRHRQRRQIDDTDLFEHLFTGPFLKTQFRQLLARAEHERAMTMARHCARLSLTDMLHICDELENPNGGETALGEDDIAFVGRIRRGLLPGGEVNGECAPSCSCMAESSVTR